ncbi:MAG: C45 family peptidase [Planctomycetota bacterium]|nr:C45 family peptidase [Planctomycetota bacterium]
MHIRVFGLSVGSLFLGLALPGCVVESDGGYQLAIQQGAKKPAAKLAEPRFRVVEKVEHGRLEDHDGLQVLRLWGTPTERGLAHARLLGREIVEMGQRELAARFARKKDSLQRARVALPAIVKFPKDVGEEIKALFAGIQQLGVDLHMTTFGRDLDLLDLEMINAMDILTVMGCSGATLWDDQVEGGGVLTGRNFDWKLTGPYMVDRCILLVQHPHEGKAFASIAWPGYVGVVTGINEDGVATFLHVGNSKADSMPLPGCIPTAMAARETLRDSDVSDAYEAASEFLRETSAPRGYLTRVVLPTSVAGQPARVFEADRARVSWREPAPYCVVTNHFLSRKGERRVSKDSRHRRQGILAEIDKTLADGGKATVADMWSYLRSVDRGIAAARKYKRPKRAALRAGTLHSLVFRNDPWVFELGIGEFDATEGITAATRSGRRYCLARDQVFAQPN